VSSLAVNVLQTDRLYNDLVSVEFSEKQLKPRKASYHPAKSRDKLDQVPNLENFADCTKFDEIKIWPKFPPITMSFQPIELYDGRSTLTARCNLRQQTKMLLNL